MDPEVMSSIRDLLSGIEKDAEIAKEEFETFKKNYLNDIQSIPTKAPKAMIQELDERLERRFKLITKDLNIKDKRLERLKRDLRNVSNEDSREGQNSGRGSNEGS